MKTFLFLFFFFQEKLEIISLSRCNNYIATVETIDRTKDKILKKNEKSIAIYRFGCFFSRKEWNENLFVEPIIE